MKLLNSILVKCVTCTILCVLTGASWCLQAQIPSVPMSLPSPNAASLGLYGEYPVSHFTGTPQISIPLHLLQSGEVTVPIVLDCHASGFRPDMHPGWVGMSWNLLAGGVISRVIRDMPDEYNNGNLSYGANNGFYYNHAAINSTSWDTPTFMENIAQSLELSTKDTEADEFMFYANGLSGTFYMGHDGQWRVRSDRPIKVTFNGSFLSVPFSPPTGSPFSYLGYFKSFSGFTITDENGVQYTFGGTTDAIEYSMEFFRQHDNHWIANSWYLTKITYPLGDEVSFTYERDGFVNQMMIAVNNSINIRKVELGTWPVICSGQYHPINQSYEGMLISPVYLTKIQAKHEEIKFQRSNSTELRYAQSVYDWRYSQWSAYSTYPSFLPFLETNDNNDTYPANLSKLQWKKLDQIRVEVDGELKKAFNFTYSASTSQRLTLQSVREQGSSGGLLKPYIFAYNTSVSLPAYLANRNDHWGFYNNTYADISNTSTYYTTYYNYRQPNATYLQAGTISRITYPTGGVTDFTFEPHYYRMEVPEQRWNAPVTVASNTLAGGLRIRKISSYDPEFPAEKEEKEYFYVKNYTNSSNVTTLASSGVLSGKAQYYFPEYRLYAVNQQAGYSFAFFSSQTLFPTSQNSSGSHVGYSEVVEKSNDNSYTVFKYSNFDNGYPNYNDLQPSRRLQLTHIILEPYTSRVHHRGRLLSAEGYNASNTLLYRRLLSYVAVGLGAAPPRSLQARHIVICNGAKLVEGTAYLNHTDAFLPSGETVYVYDETGANPVIKGNNYTYDSNYKLLKEIHTFDSHGQIRYTRYRYAFDVLTNYSSSYNNAQTYPYSYLVYSHNIATPIEVVNTVVEDGDSDRITDVSVLTHTGTRLYYDPSIHWRTVPHRIYRLKNLLPIAMSGYVPFKVTRSGSGETQTLDPGLLKETEYEFAPSRTYNKTKPVGVTDGTSSVAATIYGQFMKHPIARIDNGRFLESAYSSFETTANDSDWRGGGGQVLTRYNNQDAPVGAYCTNNTGTSGYITTYDKQLVSSFTYVLTFWEKGGTVTIRNSGAVVSSNTVLQTKGSWQQREIRFRSVSGNLQIIPAGYIDDLRLYPLGAQMTSYTYNQLGSITTSTDSKGYTTYYEYDEFNRLKRVKDRQGRIIEDYTYHLK
ncbi:YD repeat-containing protein [Parapedobacter koreensis]|uniref:YD repeat-containing protein n=2 Tax=Parapedobacter koreensis TaxID=332977 RepID=A0A1H7IN86_9SPHI|nr:YD repeat-containing protein [Parapedobacter koreensis]